MDEKTVFGLALGLAGTPWRVSDVQFDLEKRRLAIRLDFPPGSRFNHPRTGRPAPVYDTLERVWRHLNFFQFECYVHAFVPRVDDESGVNLVEVPWARPQSGFTLLMEALVVMLARTGMSVAEAARVVGEYPQRLWLILDKQVQKARAAQSLEGVETLSIDEVSRAKGHEYLTIISQPRTEQNPARVLAVAEGRESLAVAEAQRDLTRRGLDPKKVEQVCQDMSAAYLKGTKETYPNAEIIFDCFHIVQLATRAVDEVRRRERKQFPQELKHARWLLLKGSEKLNEEQKGRLRTLRTSHLQTGKAYNLLDGLRWILQMKSAEDAERELFWWCQWATRSRIKEMVKVSRTLRDHWAGVSAYLWTKITNGAAEALNGIIQTVKRKARGFKTVKNFATMIYLVAGRLQFDLPTPVPITHTTSS
jgi:transposase